MMLKICALVVALTLGLADQTGAINPHHHSLAPLIDSVFFANDVIVARNQQGEREGGKQGDKTPCEMPDGSSGYCVHSYLCESQQIVKDGAGLITERRSQCVAPKICCKHRKTNQETPHIGSRSNGDKTPCELPDGSRGYCVNSYLCESQEIIKDGAGLITERRSQCVAPKVCCKHRKTNEGTPDISSKSNVRKCKFSNGREGYCVNPNSCRNRKIMGGYSRTITSSDCLETEVCCEKDHENIESTTKSRTLVPSIPKNLPNGAQCEAYDGSIGRCTLPHTCNNDSTILDGSGLIVERKVDPCGDWGNAIQICCPAKYLAGKIPDIEATTVLTKSRSMDDEEEKDSSCLTGADNAGKCVPFHHCEDYDGADLLDKRTMRYCPALTTCCELDRINMESIPTNVKKEGCGVANPDGLWPAFKTSFLEAKFGEFPWVAAVMTKTSSFPVNRNITVGSLIHPSMVLTVAHYVDRAVDGDVIVRVGEWNTLDVNEPLPHEEVAVKKIVIHPDFMRKNYRNDIALLILEHPVKLAPHVSLVCLPEPGAVPAPDTDCVSNGWGKDAFGKKGAISSYLKKVPLPWVEHGDCQNRLRTTRLDSFFELHEGFACAGGDKLDTCSLDGGGPLACPSESDPGRYILYGVVSWGIDCHMPGIPGVYMNVAHYRTWIDQVMETEGV
ncbi:phenoloxidase-activating factor 2-like isoform X1 [Ostrinia furnacalis]|uniref:phenoloxidase-activating factor 2-like isoform X1 n=1 Tax=Ostrinia furnacalis TaxID=93504 RepID=UPI00103EA6C9|nr:phenoloxidase-activating factor 2-like isoform X1 [Ostrinia furnacalis]